MPLKDLVHYLAEKRPTGLLKIQRTGVHKEIELRDGMVVNASSNDPREFLGQFLINLGHINEDQFNKAYETQRETKIFLGKILVMTGMVKDEAIQTSLSLKFRETLLAAFQWPDGTFNFDPTFKRAQLDGLDFQIDFVDIDREAQFRETAWQAIRSAFPSGNARLTANAANLPERPKPGSLDERLLQLIREGHTIDEMALALHATDFFLYQRLYALFRLDAVAVDASVSVEEIEDEVVVEGDASASRELVEQAKAYLASSNWADAEDVARRAHQLAASPEATEVLKDAEGRLLKHLRSSFGPGKPIPKLLVAAEKVKTMKLSAPERYLLSKFDGRRDLTSIVQVSPIRELDALKFVKEFVDAGLVEFTKGK